MPQSSDISNLRKTQDRCLVPIFHVFLIEFNTHINFEFWLSLAQIMLFKTIKSVDRNCQGINQSSIGCCVPETIKCCTVLTLLILIVPKQKGSFRVSKSKATCEMVCYYSVINPSSRGFDYISIISKFLFRMASTKLRRIFLLFHTWASNSNLIYGKNAYINFDVGAHFSKLKFSKLNSNNRWKRDVDLQGTDSWSSLQSQKCWQYLVQQDDLVNK